MGTVKISKKAGSVPNKALYSRISYLHQAATYLTTQEQQIKTGTAETVATETDKKHVPRTYRSTSCHLISDMRNVSQKAIIRMSPAMKHSVCKSCDTPLIDDVTCSSQIENLSKGSKKPWADTLVRKCNICGCAKRFLTASKRQIRRPRRNLESNEEHDVQD